MQDDLRRLLERPIAHRGLHAFGGGAPVENSIGAARAAASAGYGVECDVQLSRDGEAMVFHDEHLGRLTGDDALLRDRDAASLGTLRLGTSADHLPTLHDLLAALDGRVPLVIEIKSVGDGDPRLLERTLAILRDYRGPAAVESFDPALILHARALGTSRPVGLVGPADTGTAPDLRVLAACDFLSWSIKDLEWPARHATGLPLSTWTVRDAVQVERAERHGAQIVFEGFLPAHH